MRNDPALRTAARTCFDAAIAAVDPGRLVAGALRREGDALVLDVPARGAGIHRGPVLLAGAGKAALAMANGAAAARAATGIVVVPHDQVVAGLPGIDVLGAAHPVPDAAGVEATRRVLDALRRASPETLVLV